MKHPEDLSYLEMAYGLAEKGRGWASPNPLVGAVLVSGPRIVGYGFHERPGAPHAEINALRLAGPRSRGSTLYLTLEPCVHWGRTPPCIESVIRAAPGRVVISSYDVNPLVFKRGIRRLRQAGIEVEVGLLQKRHRELNAAYIKHITSGLPLVTLKAAASLDGRIASRLGDSQWISSPGAREYGHLLRGEHDAIMVGINTILQDDPLLTVRHRQWKRKPILRAVVDSRLRLPLRARLLSTLDRGKIAVLTTAGASQEKETALRKRGVEVVRFPGRPGAVNLSRALSWLGERGIASLLVEGGSRLHTAMIEGRLADRLFLVIAPKLVGGTEAPSLLEGPGIGRMSEALGLRSLSSFAIGQDIILEGRF
ncbi:MAG: riboflavin biosynthesis protein RibD [Candidatus Aminicenantes bacterium RBG_16_63_16]|nr:MAG: riboflavin biosynthesis protein RibD [Candidatus Aminicenantes bacterium RBG_16_63_16]